MFVWRCSLKEGLVNGVARQVSHGNLGNAIGSKGAQKLAIWIKNMGMALRPTQPHHIVLLSCWGAGSERGLAKIAHDGRLLLPQLFFIQTFR